MGVFKIIYFLRYDEILKHFFIIVGYYICWLGP